MSLLAQNIHLRTPCTSNQVMMCVVPLQQVKSRQYCPRLFLTEQGSPQRIDLSSSALSGLSDPHLAALQLCPHELKGAMQGRWASAHEGCTAFGRKCQSECAFTMTMCWTRWRRRSLRPLVA
eukprot:4427299-Amphidinium_carterae.1